MTSPPDDGAFPGPPGGQPFPGAPGPPGPGRPPCPRDPRHWAVPPGPPPVLPGHAPPGGHPPPEDVYPARRAPFGLIGGAVAAVVLVGSCVAAVWNVAQSRPFADLPTCRELLAAGVVSTYPRPHFARIEGEYRPAEGAVLAEFGQIGTLSCSVGDADAHHRLSVDATLFEYEDGGEIVTGLREGAAEAREEAESGATSDGWELVSWRSLPAGDDGLAVVWDSGLGDTVAIASFVSVNVRVIVRWPLDAEGVRTDQALDHLTDLTGEIDRRLSRGAERA